MAMLHMVCHWKVRIMQHFILTKDSAGECADQISQEDKACWDKKVNTERENSTKCIRQQFPSLALAANTKLDLQSDSFLR